MITKTIIIILLSSTYNANWKKNVATINLLFNILSRLIDLNTEQESTFTNHHSDNDIIVTLFYNTIIIFKL